jgi:hypothetical protein
MKLTELPSPLEKHEQGMVIYFFRALGFTVYVVDQGSKDKGSRRTPGVPDLWVFDMKLTGKAFWWECKRRGGKRSPAQVAFGEECTKTNQLYGWGDLSAARAWVYGTLLHTTSNPVTPRAVSS